MKQFKLIFFLSLLLFISINSKSQIFCPPNVNFELGNLSNWQFYTGTCCPVNITTPGQIVGRHDLTNGIATDPYGLFPIVSPAGGSYSVKLGNDNTGSQAERAAYYVHIPAGLNNYSLVYHYAVVFEDPGHNIVEQPRFEVKVYDSATNAILPCANYVYVAGANLPGFQLSANGNQVYYKNWTISSLDLSGMGGQTVIVTFTTADCGLGAHFGYGYIDLACSLFQISSVVCNGQPFQNFSAPPGFQNYFWYDSNYVNQVGSGQNITIPTPAQNSIFHVVLIPYPGFGCIDTLTSIITIANSSSSTLNITICPPNNFLGHTISGFYIDTLVNAAGCDSVVSTNLTVVPPPLTFYTETICFPNNYFGHTTSGTYIDSFISVNGCDSVRTVNLTVKNPSSSFFIDTICEPNLIFGYGTTGIHIDTLVNSQGCDSIRTLDLTIKPMNRDSLFVDLCDTTSSYLGYTITGIYIDSFSNAIGCDSIRYLDLKFKPTYFYDTTINLCYDRNYFAGGAFQTTNGMYFDTLTSYKGCDSVIRSNLVFTVEVAPSFGFDKEICDGDSVLLFAGNYNHYYWFDGDSTVDRKWVKIAGQYTVIVTDDYYCYGFDTVEVFVNPLPNVQIEYNEKDLCKKDTINLYGTGALLYQWYYDYNFNVIRSQSNQLNFAINNKTDITLIGYDENNCRNEDNITLFYLPCCGNITAPTAFTPNGDGKNDVFRAITNAAFEEYYLKIFDRWGKEVFTATNVKESWDGYIHGTKAELGTYFYLIKAKCYDDSKTTMLKGDLMLLR